MEDSDRYYIDAVIDKNTENEWRLTGFYDEPDTARRHESWGKLRALKSRPEKPWLCYGDFNEIIRQDEKLGDARRPYNQMQEFREVNVGSWIWDLRALNSLGASTSKMGFQFGRGLIGVW